MLTVALCTYNPAEDLLRRSLDSIVPQLETVEAELLVIDNNSSLPLGERGWLDGYPLRVIRELKPGLTAARERAIESAQGDVLLFVDDDNVLHEGYLAGVVEDFA